MPGTFRFNSTISIISIVSIVLAGLIAVLVLQQHHAVSRQASSAATRPALTADQKAYLASLSFADLRMSAAVNFLGSTVTYLDGTVTNQGTKPVRRLVVELNFVDPFNQVVLRETTHPLAGHSLQPGETQAFRVTFDHMPAEWNQGPPAVKPVYVEF